MPEDPKSSPQDRAYARGWGKARRMGTPYTAAQLAAEATDNAALHAERDRVEAGPLRIKYEKGYKAMLRKLGLPPPRLGRTLPPLTRWNSPPHRQRAATPR